MSVSSDLLVQSSCQACRADAPLLTSEELAALLPHIPEWTLIQQDGVQQLKRVYRFSNFIEPLNFARQLGEMAEKEGHHPSILVEWGQLTVRWWSHKIKGLHRNDVIMAAKTEAAFGKLL